MYSATWVACATMRPTAASSGFVVRVWASRSEVGPSRRISQASLRSPPEERAGKGKRLVIANGAGAEANEDLVALMREAFAIRNWLLSGSDDSIEAMSGRLGMNKARLTSLVRLSYLAPDIVRSILEGRQPLELSATRLLSLSKDLPHEWSDQRRFLGFPG